MFGSLGFLGNFGDVDGLDEQSGASLQEGLGSGNYDTIPGYVPIDRASAETPPIGNSGSWFEDGLNALIDITRSNDAAKAAANLAAYRAGTPQYNTAAINQLNNTLTPAQQAALLAQQAQGTAFNLTKFLTDNWLFVGVGVGGLLLWKSGRK